MGLNGRPICMQTYTIQKDIVFLYKGRRCWWNKSLKEIDVLEQWAYRFRLINSEGHLKCRVFWMDTMRQREQHSRINNSFSIRICVTWPSSSRYLPGQTTISNKLLNHILIYWLLMGTSIRRKSFKFSGQKKLHFASTKILSLYLFCIQIIS